MPQLLLYAVALRRSHPNSTSFPLTSHSGMNSILCLQCRMLPALPRSLPARLQGKFIGKQAQLEVLSRNTWV